MGNKLNIRNRNVVFFFNQNPEAMKYYDQAKDHHHGGGGGGGGDSHDNITIDHHHHNQSNTHVVFEQCKAISLGSYLDETYGRFASLLSTNSSQLVFEVSESLSWDLGTFIPGISVAQLISVVNTDAKIVKKKKKERKYSRRAE